MIFVAFWFLCSMKTRITRWVVPAYSGRDFSPLRRRPALRLVMSRNLDFSIMKQTTVRPMAVLLRGARIRQTGSEGASFSPGAKSLLQSAAARHRTVAMFEALHRAQRLPSDRADRTRDSSLWP